MKVTKIFTLIVCCVIMTNCATIIHGSKQDVVFSSNPSGAEISIDGKNSGKTPVTINLSRAQNYNVKISLPGFLPQEINIVQKVDAWIIGNVIFGGLIGIVVDAATGSMYKLSPDQVNTELKKGDNAVKTKGDNVYIAVTLNVDPSWQKIGNLQKIN